jgi:hypothetical protein
LTPLRNFNLVGPAHVETRMRDVQISRFTNSLDATVDDGDVELRPETQSGPLPCPGNQRRQASFPRGCLDQRRCPGKSSGPLFQNLFQVALAVPDGDDLKRSRIGSIDNHVIGEFRQRPEAHRETRNIFPLGSHQGMFCQPPTGCDDFHFHPVGSALIVFGNKPPDGIKVFRRLRRELK